MRTINIDIHMGDKTHHQDHVMIPISLRTINTIVNKPPKPIPLEELLELLITLIFKLSYKDKNFF
jgi:hypothetical protein